MTIEELTKSDDQTTILSYLAYFLIFWFKHINLLSDIDYQWSMWGMLRKTTNNSLEENAEYIVNKESCELYKL